MNIISELIEARTFAFYAMVIMAIIVVVIAIVIIFALLSRRGKGGHRLKSTRTVSTRHRNYDDF